MLLSQTAEYALRAMISLCRPQLGAQTAQQIAAEAKVPPDYLSKVLNLLARAGLVHAQRGRGGGFQPSRVPEQITVFEILQAVDPVHRIRTCPLGISGHGENLCPLHRKLDDVARITEETFRSTTLASISGQSAPFCQEGVCNGVA